jgi:hypothetical protein
MKDRNPGRVLKAIQDLIDCSISTGNNESVEAIVDRASPLERILGR